MTEFLSFAPPQIDRTEILRYAKSFGNEVTASVLDEYIEKCEGVLNYNVGFCELKFTPDGDCCNFCDFSVKSKSLAENLKAAKRVFLAVFSVGHGIDRLIAKYSRSMPSIALIINAIGTERVEALADAFTLWLEDKTSLVATPRFSAGYGDLPLSLQRDIFKALAPEIKMGVFLSDACVMTPSKSVTAFIGLK